MLTWIMFLKFLDDNERERETTAMLEETPFVPAIQAPYRWRDWADSTTGTAMTGDDFLAFINNERCTLPDGSEGAGLLYYLRGLRSESGKERKDVIASVFKGVLNRMASGYLLREVVNKIDTIHFDSTEEMHTLSRLYESIIKEMRDAAGDSGEFYTPRPVVKLMVEIANPRLGETVLDPACGTGGFLVEAFEHLNKQANTIQEREIVQQRSIFGGEVKPLPYLLCQMNLLLHGLEYPDIDSQNSLRFKLQDIGDRERVDVILANPPFGGDEERTVLDNFPADKQTTETALLFLQVMMRRLKRKKPTERGGRAAVVVPNGTLFQDGIAARIKHQLLSEFNLHTIVRLPDGVFAPYTDIPANLLFFEHGSPTTTIWYYELPAPDGRKKYSKTKPLQYEEFAPLLAWWQDRTENDDAWTVQAKDLIVLNDKGVCTALNLDVKNPKRKSAFEYREPREILSDILDKEREIVTLLEELHHTFSS